MKEETGITHKEADITRVTTSFSSSFFSASFFFKNFKKGEEARKERVCGTETSGPAVWMDGWMDREENKRWIGESEGRGSGNERVV